MSFGNDLKQEESQISYVESILAQFKGGSNQKIQNQLKILIQKLLGELPWDTQNIVQRKGNDKEVPGVINFQTSACIQTISEQLRPNRRNQIIEIDKNSFEQLCTLIMHCSEELTLMMVEIAERLNCKGMKNKAIIMELIQVPAAKPLLIELFKSKRYKRMAQQGRSKDVHIKIGITKVFQGFMRKIVTLHEQDLEKQTKTLHPIG